MKEKISIILPTYNEAENIKGVIMQLNKYAKPLEIIVVDDNSPDGTAKKAKEAASNVKVIIRKNERGVGSAIKRGIEEAQGDIVTWMDADLSMPPSLVPKLLAELKNYDIAIASRYVRGGQDKRSFGRVLTSRALNLVASLLLGYGIKDYDTGFVAVKKDVFKEVSFSEKGHGEYCIEFLYNACRAGFKVKEIPFVFTERVKGKSKTVSSIFSYPLHGFRYLWRIFSIKLRNR